MVFKLSAPTTGGSWTEALLHSFMDGSDGGLLEGGVVMIGGVLYGTTFLGPGPCQWGRIYSLTP